MLPALLQNPVLDPVLGHGLAASLALILLPGALHKLREPLRFQAAVADYALLPLPWVPLLAWGLCLLELAAGLCLLPLPSRLLGASMALLALALASTGVALALSQGRRQIDCGCGSGVGLRLSAGLLWRNAVLMLAAALAALPLSSRPVAWPDGLATCAVTLFSMGLYAVVNQLLANQPRLQELRNSP